MTIPTITGLVNNAALLITLVLVYDVAVLRKLSQKHDIYQLPVGFFLGVIGILIMMTHWHSLPGLIFDTRSVLLCISGLFFGTIPTLIAVIITSAYRLYIGGPGLWVGIAVIITSGATGLVWRHLLPQKSSGITSGSLYLLGLATHVVMLLCMFLMPFEMALNVLKDISLPVIFVFPLTTLLLGKLMTNRFARIESTRALRESEKKFRDLFEHHAAAKMLIDTETGSITEANSAAAAFYGWSKTKLKKMRIHDINILSAEEIHKKLAKAASLDRGYFEFQHRLADGSLHDVEVYSSRVEVDGREHLHSIIHDVTERKRTERELARQKKLFETMFNTIPDCVVITDPERRIMLANRGLLSTFGYTMDELLGTTTEKLYAAQDKYQQAGSEIYSDEADSDGNRYVTSYKDSNGRLFIGETFGAKLFDNDGEWLGNLGVIRDISAQLKQEEQQIQLEKQLLQAHKMEALGTLAGGIAHDFNNILGVIMGYAEMVRENSDTDSLTAGDTEQITLAAGRARDLVAQILAFSRQAEVETAIVQPAAIIKEIVKLLRATLPSTIDVRQEIKTETGYILADPSQIHQILMNLCTNAFHAMEETGGILTLRLETTVLDPTSAPEAPLRQAGKFQRLEVSDTGCGIAEEVLERIFNPFFTTKTQGKGTGMGLAIAHGIVSHYGGVIRCDSEVGKGTTFTLFLPEAEGERHTTEQPQPQIPAAVGSEHILLVDDEKILAQMTHTMLTRLGYRVSMRTSSLEALAAFENQPDDFDLIITDQTMPEMTGLELARRILRVRPQLPIILCTGFSATINEKKALAAGIKAFAMKPLVKDTMATLIREVLS